MPRRITAALTVLLLLVATRVLAGQVQLSRLDGIVLDSAGQPMAAAFVTLSDPLGGVVRHAAADAHGRFVVPDLAPGRYRIHVDGSRAEATPVVVADGLPASVTVRVPTAFREALSVEGLRMGSAVSSRTSLAAESIARTPVRAGAQRLQDVVATLPGWATEDNGLLHSRGVDDGFLYVVDGVPVYERLDQTSGLAPDSDTVEALSVITGYVPPEYGYKAGGVIDVRTSAGIGPWRGSASMGGGSDAAADGEASAGGAIGRATLWFQGRGQRSSRFLDPVDPDNLHNDGHSVSTAGQVTTGAGTRDRVVASWSGGSAGFDIPNTEAQEAAGQAQRQQLSQGAGTATWQRVWSGQTVSQLAGYARHSDVRLDPSLADTPLTTEADRGLTRLGALLGLTRQAGAHVLKAGTEIQQLRLREAFGFAVTDDDAAAEAGLSEAALRFDADDPFRFDGRARAWLYAFYLQDTWQATPVLTVAAGLRFDRTRLLLPRHQWSPRLGLAFAASSRTTLRASISRFYQPPQAEYLLLASSPDARALSPFAGDDADQPGGADIEPERQWAFEGGVEHRFGRGVRADVSYWQRHVDQYADPNVFFGTTIVFPNAVAAGRARGLDARLEVAPDGPWSGYGNLSVGKVTQTGPLTGGLFLERDVAEIGPGVEFVPDHDQRVVASGGLTWTGHRAALSVAARYESGTPIELDDDAEAGDLAARPGADRVDFARGRVRPRTVASVIGTVPMWRTGRAAVSLRASVLNLLGDRYAYNFGNPFSGTHFGAPRTASVAVRVETR